jgi:Flp pilus assembly protein TadG
MIDLCDQTFLLNQLPHSELEKAEEAIFKDLTKAFNRRDLRLIEIFSFQLSSLVRYMRQRGVNQSGQVLLEFAFTLPLICLILIGGLDLGVAIVDKGTLNAAASAAAMYGSLSRDPRVSFGEIEAQAMANLGGLLLGRDPVVQIEATGSAPEDSLRVQVRATESLIFFADITMQGTFVTRYQ